MVNMNGGGANGLANTAALLGKNFLYFIMLSLNWLIIEIAKGQIISKCPFSDFKSNQQTNKIIYRIYALAYKRCQIKKL